MMMKTIALTGLLGLAPFVAFADSSGNARVASGLNGQKSISEIETQLNADGFQIIELERDRRSYEVKGLEKGGRCVELRVDAKSGKVLHRERDDDCGRDDDHDDRRSYRP